MTYSMKQFMYDIQQMNIKYDLPLPEVPTPPTTKGLIRFHDKLSEEIHEILTIGFKPSSSLSNLVDLADVLADIIVYCASEAAKHGLDISEILEIVMESNESKLGLDGLPIKDSRGKFLKGPNFKPPEP